MKIIKGYVSTYQNEYYDVRNIHFDDLKDLKHMGTLLAQTERDSNDIFCQSSFGPETGVYIFQAPYDTNRALRVTKEYYIKDTNETLELRIVPKLIEKQPNVKLTEFPSAIVTVDNRIIGQEIPYYYNHKTLLSTFIDYDMQDKVPTHFQLEVLKILKELYENGIVYTDTHGKNFLVDPITSNVKLIDFDYGLVAFDDNMKYSYSSMINNVKQLIITLNKIAHIETPKIFYQTQTLSQIEESVQENHYVLTKKRNS